MNSILVFCAVTVFALAATAASGSDTATSANKMSEQLQAFLDGKLPPEKLTITYRDVRGLKGELKIVVQGTGKVEQQLIRRKAPEPQNLDAEAVRELVKLIVEQEAWTQKTPQELRKRQRPSMQTTITQIADTDNPTIRVHDGRF